MTIAIEAAVKRYGTNAVVNHVSLQVDDGELLVLIGPSGSGKSTLLRMIAGLTSMDGGRIVLHGRDVTAMAPQQRGVGFVFQNYALFRHMSAAENVEYGLQVRKVPLAERRRRVDELLDLVGLAGFGKRLPSQLSGGQQQRIALARALAFRPDVLLLDEPFGALDAKIRTELRRSVKRIQREIGISTIFVTHDQEEAFALADRVGVMHDGELVELGASEDLYLSPRQDFTATFLGAANLLLGLTTNDGVRVGDADFSLFSEAQASEAQRVAKILVRPEDISVSKLSFQQDSRFVCEAVVSERMFSGSSERIRLAIEPRPGLQVLHPAPVFGDREAYIEVLRSRTEVAAERLQPGDSVYVGFRRIHCLDVLSSLPVLGGRHAVQFLESIRRPGPTTDELSHKGLSERANQMPAQGTGEDAMEIDNDKVLVWFGEPKRIERILINLSGNEPEDRELIHFAKQMFSAGRPPSIDLFMAQEIGSMINSSSQQFMAAAKRELQQLSTPVRINQRIGQTLQELRLALDQSDSDLLISALPSLAVDSHASGELSSWVVRNLGPVASMFLLSEDIRQPITEQAA